MTKSILGNVIYSCQSCPKSFYRYLFFKYLKGNYLTLLFFWHLILLSFIAQAEIDCEKIHQLCWKIVEQKFQKCGSHLLSFDAAFKQFIIFNILDIEETSKVEKEEIAIILEKFEHAMGQVWNPKPLQEFCEGDVMTFWQYIQCLEEKYIFGNDPR